MVKKIKREGIVAIKWLPINPVFESKGDTHNFPDNFCLKHGSKWSGLPAFIFVEKNGKVTVGIHRIVNNNWNFISVPLCMGIVDIKLADICFNSDERITIAVLGEFEDVSTEVCVYDIHLTITFTTANMTVTPLSRLPKLKDHTKTATKQENTNKRTKIGSKEDSITHIAFDPSDSRTLLTVHRKRECYAEDKEEEEEYIISKWSYKPLSLLPLPFLPSLSSPIAPQNGWENVLCQKIDHLASLSFADSFLILSFFHSPLQIRHKETFELLETNLETVPQNYKEEKGKEKEEDNTQPRKKRRRGDKEVGQDYSVCLSVSANKCCFITSDSHSNISVFSLHSFIFPKHGGDMVKEVVLKLQETVIKAFDWWDLLVCIFKIDKQLLPDDFHQLIIVELINTAEHLRGGKYESRYLSAIESLCLAMFRGLGNVGQIVDSSARLYLDYINNLFIYHLGFSAHNLPNVSEITDVTFVDNIKTHYPAAIQETELVGAATWILDFTVFLLQNVSHFVMKCGQSSININSVHHSTLTRQYLALNAPTPINNIPSILLLLDIAFLKSLCLAIFFCGIVLTLEMKTSAHNVTTASIKPETTATTQPNSSTTSEQQTSSVNTGGRANIKTENKQDNKNIKKQLILEYTFKDIKNLYSCLHQITFKKLLADQRFKTFSSSTITGQERMVTKEKIGVEQIHSVLYNITYGIFGTMSSSELKLHEPHRQPKHLLHKLALLPDNVGLLHHLFPVILNGKGSIHGSSDVVTANVITSTQLATIPHISFCSRCFRYSACISEESNSKLTASCTFVCPLCSGKWLKLPLP